MRRIVALTAMVAAFAVVLSGCSLWQDGEKVAGQVQESIVAHQVLTELTDELRARDGVESAESSVVPVYRTASVTVEFRKGSPAIAVAEVVTRVDEVLRGAELQPFKREFSVQAGDAGILQTSFDRAPIDYAAELAYWDAVQSAIGTGITLTLGADRAGEFQRILSTETDATVAAIADHYDDVAALEPPDAAETRWRLPGFAGYADWLGPVPERGILTFLASMAGVTNLLGDSVQEPPPGVYVNLSDARGESPPSFVFASIEPSSPEDMDTARKLGLRMAREALASGLPALRISVIVWGGDIQANAHVHLGECTDLNPPTAADRKLVADLAASGVALPEGAAGLCLAFATP